MSKNARISAHVADIEAGIAASSATIGALVRLAPEIARSCELVITALRLGRKILTAGNGGSAAESLHMAEEFTGRFRSNRRSLPAVSLSADPTALTCIGNDFGFDNIFARQIEGLGNEGDVLILFSTSGKAANLTAAVAQARRSGLKVVSFLGRSGGPLAGLSDVDVIVPGTHTERIQEAHLVLVHLLLDAVEKAFPPETCG
jgi:D-sedoheptulose 7-phosphate isomerase